MCNINQNQTGRFISLILMYYNNMKQKNTLSPFKSKLSCMFDKKKCVFLFLRHLDQISSL